MFTIIVVLSALVIYAITVCCLTVIGSCLILLLRGIRRWREAVLPLAIGALCAGVLLIVLKRTVMMEDAPPLIVHFSYASSAAIAGTVGLIACVTVVFHNYARMLVFDGHDA